jgi:hypothetical protein
MPSHPHEIKQPLLKVGKNPAFPREIARIWIADEKHGGDFVNVVYAPSKNAEMYAWIILRLAFDISAEYAKKKKLDPIETEERVIKHIELNLIDRFKKGPMQLL